MRRSIWIIAAALLFAPLMAAQAAKPLVIDLTYLGHGNYLFQKVAYTHATVVQAVQAANPGVPIELVSVVMPAGVTLLDRRDVCLLRLELQTKVKMRLIVGDGTDATAPQFCN